jgi:PAS domain S-box-containing protein
MGVEQYLGHLDASTVLAALLAECSAATDYVTLRDNLPRHLAVLLRCRCILLYQRIDETLQFASGSFADQPGWSSTLLAVAHINPIELNSDLPEARAWRTCQAVADALDGVEQARACAPLLYHQRAVGVLSAIRGLPERMEGVEDPANWQIGSWSPCELSLIEVVASVVAMLLENTRLLEREHARIQELSLLNSISSQMNCSLRERPRVQRIAVQRAREIAAFDLCELLLPGQDVSEEAENWLPAELRSRLWQHWSYETQATPLLLERMGGLLEGEYMGYLAPRIQTCLVIPFVGNREQRRAQSSTDSLVKSGEQEMQIDGLLVGAYYRPVKLRREEQVVLQVLTSQVSAVLENITLMEDVLAARNETRRLLLQVLDEQRQQELILEHMPSGLLTINRLEQITTCNRAAGAILGYHPLEVLGQPLRKILDLPPMEQVLRNGQGQRLICSLSERQGQEITLDVTLAPLRAEDGELIGALATFADVTAMHRLEEETRRLDRLATLGQMSASVAHEVRNPLASIKTSMQLLRADLEGSGALQQADGVQEEVEVIMDEIERLDAIVRDLLLFARPRQTHRAACDLGALSERVLHLLQAQCSIRGVRVLQTGRDDLPLISLDASQIEQVLLNLCLNAIQAMPEGGTLAVSCQVVPSADLAEPHLLFAEPARYRGKWLELTISDTGTGIAPEDLARVFQPFHTTKAHGIGLGLSVTRRFIEDHQGTILIESQPGYGTTVTVRLPLDVD